MSRIVLTLVVFEDAEGEPRTNITIGEGFEDHKESIGRLLSYYGTRWSGEENDGSQE